MSILANSLHSSASMHLL